MAGSGEDKRVRDGERTGRREGKGVGKPKLCRSKLFFNHMHWASANSGTSDFLTYTFKVFQVLFYISFVVFDM